MASENDAASTTYLATMLGSATSGILARFPCHPLDTVKAKLQVQTAGVGASQYRGILHTLRSVVATQGFKGLYRGFGVTAVVGAPASMLYFTSYEMARDALADSHPLLGKVPALPHLLGGLVAEALSCVLWVPVDVIKERMQVQEPPRPGAAPSPYYTSTTHAVRSILASEGLVGVYRGYWATLLSFGPFSALYFVLYEQCKAAARAAAGGVSDAELPAWSHAVSGGVAGAGAAWLTTPLDLVKLRLQVQRGGTPTPFHYTGVRHALTSIAAAEGPAALFRGAVARMAFSAPMTAISFALFESCKSAFAERLR